MATKIDAFVYNTIAQWYNEDAKVRAPAWLPKLSGRLTHVPERSYAACACQTKACRLVPMCMPLRKGTRMLCWHPERTGYVIEPS